jgi:hypothetical protein
MIANDKQFLHAWIVEKLQESNENNFVVLLEIKKKSVSEYHIDVVVFLVPLIEVEMG